jgi:hypothetical protein
MSSPDNRFERIKSKVGTEREFDYNTGTIFYTLAGVAQLVEQLICNQQVVSSILTSSSELSFGGDTKAVKWSRL